MQKKYFLLTYLPYFFSDRYRKQTIYFFRPYELVSLHECSSIKWSLITEVAKRWQELQSQSDGLARKKYE